MKRSDWLNNKDREIPPRPTRIFNLTDEIIDSIKKNHISDIKDWPELREGTIVKFLESIPEFIDSGVACGEKGISKASDPDMNLFVVKTDRWSCFISLVITKSGLKMNHAFVISKNTQGLFTIDSSMCYPALDEVYNPFTTTLPNGTHYSWENTADPATVFTTSMVGGGGSGGSYYEGAGSHSVDMGTQSVGEFSHAEGNSTISTGTPRPRPVFELSPREAIQAAIQQAQIAGYLVPNGESSSDRIQVYDRASNPFRTDNEEI